MNRQVEKIKSEIERLLLQSEEDERESKRNSFPHNAIMHTGEQVAYTRVLDLINSMQEAPSGKELDEYFISQVRQMGGGHKYDNGRNWITAPEESIIQLLKDNMGVNNSPVSEDLEKSAEELYPDEYYSSSMQRCGAENIDRCEQREAFIAGAKWQKDKMMKNAIEGTPVYTTRGYKRTEVILPDHYKDGDKIKLIIVKGEK